MGLLRDEREGAVGVLVQEDAPYLVHVSGDAGEVVQNRRGKNDFAVDLVPEGINTGKL